MQHILDYAGEAERRLKMQYTVSLHGQDVAAKRKEVLEYFHATYDLYEKLFETLTEKAFYMRADPLRHPLIFYFGHTACFFINKLRLAKVVKARVNKEYESMFAIGVDEMSWDDLLPDGFNWPSVKDVQAYRNEVRAVVEEAIHKTELKLPITWDDPFWGILMGIEHERIHLETSTVLIRQLPLSVLTGPSDFWNVCPVAGPAPQNELLPALTETRKVRLGKEYDADYYGWDNEYGVQETLVTPFKASRFLVSNGEYLEFVKEGGYQTREFWTEEGWKWANFRSKKRACHPIFWISILENGVPTGNYRLRLMLQEIDMPWDWPVEVNNLEAKAFCNWKRAKTGKSIRLPQEDEYRILREQLPVEYPQWKRSPGNFHMEYYCSSTPVDAFPPTAGGFYDVVGNVWQHTETPIDAFKGFRVHKWYDDFSVPTFDLQHNMICGGSWITTGNEAVRESRYAFRRHFFQHAGFRYVETDREVRIRDDTYERDDAVAIYAHFHYGPEFFGVPNFAKSVAEFALRYATEKGRRLERALDIGCATGRSAFELARAFDYVLGLDFSARFIRKAVQLQEQDRVTYTIVEEGDITTDVTKSLQELQLEDVKKKCEFFQADACNLDPRYQKYDLVLAANLIEYLYEPALFLRLIHDRITPKGLLVIGSTYNFNETFTPKDLWLGGHKDANGKAVSGFQGLESVLKTHFRLVDTPVNIPYVLRHSKRTYDHNVSEVSVWEKL